ncbi:putative multidrug resistance protein mdtD [Nocardioides sp. PD653]|nr:Putative multidrug resistance protein mdtD [Nocardioides sp. PD653-B2]GAW53699.1 putative multidrug resistance protein mdtD [Nocardioides sp. PD653]
MRAAIGVAAAMTAPGSMAMAFRLFDDDALRIRTTAVISTVGLVGLAVGPTVGGLMLAIWPWQALLAVNVPVAVLAGICIRLGIPADDTTELHREPLDLLGALLGTATITLVLWTATLVVEDGWSSPTPYGTGVTAVACAAAFVLRERRAPHPMLDLELLKRPLVTAGVTYQAAIGLAVAGLAYSVTLQLQLVWGWPPALAAIGNLPQVVTMIVAGPFVEKIVKKVGMNKAGPLGAAAVITGLLVYALLGRYGYPWIAATLVLSAAGMRLVMITAAVNVMRGLPPDQTSLGASLNDTSQEVASSIGLAVVGTIVAAALTGTLADIGHSSADAQAFENAVTTATLVLTATCALLVAWAGRRTRHAAPAAPHRDTQSP